MKLILDTNIVLDWLVFNDSSTHALQAALVAGRIEAMAHRMTLDELCRVLAYPNLQLDPALQRTLFAKYCDYAVNVELPQFARQNLLLPAGFPMCRDTDDQPFLALAFHTKATLVSKDKAVLRLRKSASRFGVSIVEMTELNAALNATERNE